MTVTKARNRIANKNTGGNKKQGLVPSTGKSNNIRSKQLYKAASNDKTIYCINQIGGIGRNRSVFKIGDSARCIKNYTLQNAVLDSIAIVNLKGMKIATLLLETPYRKYLYIYNSADSPYILSNYSYHEYYGDCDYPPNYKTKYYTDSDKVTEIKDFKETNKLIPDESVNPFGFDLYPNYFKEFELSNNDYNLYLKQHLFIHARLDISSSSTNSTNKDFFINFDANNLQDPELFGDSTLASSALKDKDNKVIVTRGDVNENVTINLGDGVNEEFEILNEFYFALYPNEHLYSYSKTNYPVIDTSFSLGVIKGNNVLDNPLNVIGEFDYSNYVDETNRFTYKPNFEDSAYYLIDASLNTHVGYLANADADYVVKLFEMNNVIVDNHRLHNNYYVTISSYTPTTYTPTT